MAISSQDNWKINRSMGSEATTVQFSIPDGPLMITDSVEQPVELVGISITNEVMKRLLSLRKTTELEITGCDTVDISQLVTIASLQTLSVTHTPVTMSSQFPPSKLSSLTLDYTHTSRYWRHLIGSLRAGALSELKTLSLAGNGIGDDGLVAITPVLPAVECLNLADNGITTIAPLTAVASSLGYLNVRCNSIATSASLADLVAAPAAAIHTLYAGCQLADKPMDITDMLDVMADNTNLTLVDLQGCTLDAAAMDGLITVAGSNIALTDIVLQPDVVSAPSESWDALSAALASNNTITTLDLGRHHVQLHVAQSIAHSVRMNVTLAQTQTMQRSQLGATMERPIQSPGTPGLRVTPGDLDDVRVDLEGLREALGRHEARAGEMEEFIQETRRSLEGVGGGGGEVAMNEVQVKEVVAGMIAEARAAMLVEVEAIIADKVKAIKPPTPAPVPAPAGGVTPADLESVRVDLTTRVDALTERTGSMQKTASEHTTAINTVSRRLAQAAASIDTLRAEPQPTPTPTPSPAMVGRVSDAEAALEDVRHRLGLVEADQAATIAQVDAMQADLEAKARATPPPPAPDTGLGLRVDQLERLVEQALTAAESTSGLESRVDSLDQMIADLKTADLTRPKIDLTLEEVRREIAREMPEIPSLTDVQAGIESVLSRVARTDERVDELAARVGSHVIGVPQATSPLAQSTMAGPRVGSGGSTMTSRLVPHIVTMEGSAPGSSVTSPVPTPTPAQTWTGRSYSPTGQHQTQATVGTHTTLPTAASPSVAMPAPHVSQTLTHTQAMSQHLPQSTGYLTSAPAPVLDQGTPAPAPAATVTQPNSGYSQHAAPVGGSPAPLPWPSESNDLKTDLSYLAESLRVLKKTLNP